MKEISINLTNSYKITVASGFKDFANVMPLLKGEKVAIITDSNVDEIYKDALSGYITGKKIYKYVIKAGENSKDIKTYATLLENLAKDGFTRSDSVIVFGGGVVGDLGAFVASTYMRGITLIAVPTTLLSMVDSSVGGKTAINLSVGKNLCGSFYQPGAVYINVDLVKTLPRREIICGYGEVFKYAFIDGLNFDKYFSNVSEQLICDCLAVKKQIVEKDEKESGDRKLLNFGHTIGHALEKINNFSLSHGECVAVGIYYALIMSSNYFGTSKKIANDFLEKVKNFGFDLNINYNLSKVKDVVYADKKRKGEFVDFVLLNKENKLQIIPISIEKIESLLK